MRYDGQFEIALHGSAELLCALPELTRQWLASLPESYADEWVTADINEIIKILERYAKDFTDKPPKEPVTEHWDYFSNIALLVPDCLDNLVRRKPELEVAVMATISDSVTDTPVRYNYYSPAGSTTICPGRTVKDPPYLDDDFLYCARNMFFGGMNMSFPEDSDWIPFTKKNRSLSRGGLWSYEGEGGDIDLPKGVKEIGDKLFRKRKDITSVTLPEGVEVIGVRAFEGCTELRRIYLPKYVEKIGSNAFLGCSALTEFVVDPQNPKFQSVDGALLTGDGKTFLLCPGGRTGCCTVPDGVQEIGAFAFGDCVGLTRIQLPDSLKRIGRGAFSGCTGLTELRLPPKLTTLAASAFDGCTGLTELEVPEGVKTIPEKAFRGCTGLVRLRLPRTLETMESDLMEGCSALEEIAVAEGNQVYQSVDGVLFAEGGKILLRCPAGKSGHYTVPEGVEQVGDYRSSFGRAFHNCVKLTGVTLPKTVTDLMTWAFTNCSALANIEVDPESPKFQSVDGALLTKNGKTLLRCSGTYTVPAGVTELGTNAFSGHASLTELTVPEGVTVLGAGVFSGCTGLERITLPESLTDIQNYAFLDCKKLECLDLPAGVKWVGYEVFRGCKRIKRIVFRGTKVKFDDFALRGCPKKLVLCAPAGSSIEKRAKKEKLAFEAL